MAPRNENRSERRRIATEREKKRIEAFNQQVERIKELVCPEMTCPTKSKILRAAVDRLNYLEELAARLSAQEQASAQENPEQVYYENETSSGYNSDDAPVNYAQQELIEFNQNSNSSVEFDSTADFTQTVYTQPIPQANEQLYVPYYQDVQYEKPDTDETTKQESYDNFFRQFLDEWKFNWKSIDFRTFQKELIK